MEGDVREEALWRLSKPFFRSGSGVCWISPTLQNGNGIEGLSEADEENWTVYRPIMSLKEAQEEDARDLARHMADKHLDTRCLPRKEHTAEVKLEKAPPLRHLWHQAKVVLKCPKTVDYSKVYRRALEE